MEIISSESKYAGLYPVAFIVYKPSCRKIKETISCNNEAWKILSYDSSPSEKHGDNAHALAALCSQWRVMLEKSINETEAAGSDEPESHYVDLFKSGRRRYRVMGLPLSSQQTDRQQEKHFMFIIERIYKDSINYPLIFRDWKLNNREQDMVRLILEDKSNKEIAYLLGLSLNTVKGYMKLLMRKVGVTSRAGIVSLLLTKRKR